MNELNELTELKIKYEALLKAAQSILETLEPQCFTLNPSLMAIREAHRTLRRELARQELEDNK